MAGHDRIGAPLVTPRLRVALDLRWLEQAYRNSPAGGLGGVAVLGRNLWIGLARSNAIDLVALADNGDMPPAFASLIAQAPHSSLVRAGGPLPAMSENRASRRLLQRVFENELPVGTTVRRLDVDVLHRLDQVAPPQHAPFATVVTICDLIPFAPARGPISLRDRLVRRCERSMIAASARADAAATISEITARQLLQHVPALDGRVQVIFIGIDPPARNNPSKRVHPNPYFLHVGVLTERKNPAGLIDAFAQYAKRSGSGAHLVCAGPYSVRPDVVRRVRALAERFDVTAFVHVLDRVDDATLGDLYRGAEALVFPSFDEGFGLPIVEALAVGTPCITADIPACREAAGELGLYIDAASADSIALGMEKACETGHRQRVARLGPGWAQRFSIDEMAAKYVDLYRQAVERRNNQRQSAAAHAARHA